jgi:DNA polymerase I-like protein with 3'-5' exonuclease and polymerase domains
MYQYIKEKSELKIGEFMELLGTTLAISIDVEASSIDTITAEWILFQVKLGDSIYVFDAGTLDRKFLSYLLDLINCSQKPIIAHNSKYDLKIIFRGTGILLQNIHDTMLIESILYRGLGKVFYTLAELVELYTGEILLKDIRATFENFKGELSIEQLSYAAMDVLYLETIYNRQLEFISQKNLDKIYRLEMDLVPVLVVMELTGVYLDKQEWLSLKEKAVKDREESYNKILDMFMQKVDFSKYASGAILADTFRIPIKTKKARLALESLIDPSVLKDWLRENININSSHQLLSILVGIYGLEIESTNEKILKDIKDREIIPYILNYREYNKKITTYGEDFLKHIHPVTGRVHSEFLQNGTTSGRFSSTNPNLQNIPKEKRYRMTFKAPSEKKLITLDFSQQEYRLAGAISKDPVIIESYIKGEDMHTATAAIIMKKKLEDITNDDRSFGKTINFAVLYGSTEYGLAFNLKISVEAARRFLMEFYKGYPILAAFKRAVEDEIWKRKYSSTVMGRKRYWEDKTFFADYREADKWESRVRREGFNHIIQGTGADVTKLAMIKMFKENPFGDSFKLVMQIHDEIVVEVADEIAKEAEIFGKKCMIDVFQPFLGKIPAAVDSNIGQCWTK